MLKIINPATQQIITEIPMDNTKTIRTKVAQARQAQKEWAKTSFSQRAAIISKFKDLLIEQIDRCAADQSAETGKPLHQAKGEINGTIARIDFFLNEAAARQKDMVVVEQEGLSEKIAQEPLGVVVNISAWNFPYFVGANAFIPALLTGNAVVYKPSEYSSLTGAHIVRLLNEAGLPSTIMPLIVGGGEVGSALLDEDIDGVFFTGSYNTGVKIAAKVAPRMIKLGLELGGKDPIYACDDVDPKAAAEAIGDGCFYNAGQSCCSVERIYVHEKIYPAFVTALANFAKAAKVGSPTSADTYIGPLTRGSQIQVLESQIADAKAKGAKILAGGTSHELGGNYFQPTVVSDCNHSMEIMTEESFGPIIGVMPVKDDAEALQLMNETKYGLTAGVFTKDRQRAEKIMQELNSGTVYWNCCDRVSPHLPWSGRKHSGIGSTLSVIGIDAFMRPKAWHLKEPC